MTHPEFTEMHLSFSKGFRGFLFKLCQRELLNLYRGPLGTANVNRACTGSGHFLPGRDWLEKVNLDLI